MSSKINIFHLNEQSFSKVSMHFWCLFQADLRSRSSVQVIKDQSVRRRVYQGDHAELSWLRYSIITMFQRHWWLVTRVSGCHLTMTSSHISSSLTPPLLHPLYQWSVSPLVCRGQYLLQCWPVVMCTMLPVSPGPLQTRCVSRGWMRSRLKYSTQCVPVTSRYISAVLWGQYSFWPLSTIFHVF